MATLLFAVFSGFPIGKVADYFKDKGHFVTVSHDGLAVERRLREDPPDVLVVSVLIAPTDAFALKDLVHRHHLGRTQILLLTALAADGTPYEAWNHPFEAQCISRDFWQMVLCIQQLIDFRLQPKSSELIHPRYQQLSPG